MLTIIHGDHLVKSREALLEIKKRYQKNEIIELAANIDLTTVKQALESNSLFKIKRLVIFEKLLAKRGRRKDDKVINYLAQDDFDTDVVLWEDIKINPNILSKLKKAEKKLYQPVTLLFKYLDSIRPGKPKQALWLLHQVVEREPIELIFYMTVRRMRMLLAFKEKAETPELKRLASWQKAKLARQTASFNSSASLILLLNRLFDIEYKQKTGQAGLNLIQELDILLVSL